MFKRFKGFMSNIQGRFLFALVSLMLIGGVASAQVTSADGAIDAFQTQATSLLNSWGTVAVGLAALWVGLKLGPKIIKRLSSAV